MEHTLAWKTGDFFFFICILLFTAGFLTFHFISKSEKLKSRCIARFGEENFSVHWILFERLLGILFFGIVPAFILTIGFHKNLSDYGFSSDHLLLSFYWILGLSPLIILMNYSNHRSKDNLAMYPQIRKKEWNFQLVLLSALSWTAYLLAYEFMFRGYLLFIAIEYIGVWPALALNICIYALVHVPKGYKEAVGAIPLGIVLGLITVKTGNIWTALVVHVVMALSNEWLSLKAHPEMKFIKK